MAKVGGGYFFVDVVFVVLRFLWQGGKKKAKKSGASGSRAGNRSS